MGVGCDDDSPLPAGFEDANKVELVQAYLSDEQSGDDEFVVPEGIHDRDTSLSIRGGRGHVLYVGNVGCNNPYAGYVTHDGDAYKLLLRFESNSGARNRGRRNQWHVNSSARALQAPGVYVSESA
ncbi:MAG TPA: hypothetical protein VJV78_22380 [Polyangiales bacterium]|nr:hypothetical protein [Polyangiales bacterium]